MSVLISTGCKEHRQSSNYVSERSGYQILISTDSIGIDDNDALLTLGSYTNIAAESVDTQDGLPVLYCYNYRTHALDVLNLAEGRFVESLSLEKEGPEGIPGRIRSVSWEGDSIMIYDTIGIYFLSKNGKVTSRFPIKEFSRCPVDRNARSAGISLRYLPDKQRLLFPVVNRDNSIDIVTFDLPDSELNRKKLPGTELNKDVSTAYGFMFMPNITFTTDSTVVYNYPYSSDIHLFNLSTEESATITVPAKYTGEATQCEKPDDAEEVTWHGIENPHYYPVEYLPEADIYVRLALGPTSLPRTAGLAEAMNQRRLYMTVFDREFNTITELELPENRYDPFFGWITLPDGIAFFTPDKSGEKESTGIEIMRFTRE